MDGIWWDIGPSQQHLADDTKLAKAKVGLDTRANRHDKGENEDHPGKGQEGPRLPGGGLVDPP